MEKQFIKYNGKNYEVKEPTIDVWGKLASLQDWTEENEFSVLLISEVTGLSKDEILMSDWKDILVASQNLSNYLLNQGKEFYNEFEFGGQKYKFVDLPNLSFGEFVDIDSYLTKPLVERRRELHFLAAMLYREVDEDGNIKRYNGNDLPGRAEKFKKLPIKYLNGAISFFLLIEKISRGNIQISLRTRFKMRMKVIWTLVKLIVLTSIGAGLIRWSLWRKKTSLKSNK
jgi:hypothetical protein